MFRPVRRSAFTRIEVMVVVGVVGSLIGLLIPAVQSARERARRMHCTNNLKQIALAVHNYHDTYKRLPSGWLAPHPDDPTKAGSWAWGTIIIPFLQGNAIYDKLCSCRYPPLGQTEHDVVMHTYHCPTASGPDYNANYAGYSRSDYVVVHGAARDVSNSIDAPSNGAFSMNSDVSFADIEDGTQFTLMAGERSMTRDERHGAIWMRAINRTGDGMDGTSVAGVCHRDVPLNSSTQGSGFLSWHSGGTTFAMMDGSVQFVVELIDATTYESLAQIRDGRQPSDVDLVPTNR